MSAHTCPNRASLPDLVAYHCGDLPQEAAARVEEAYFACDACTELLAWVARLDEELVSLVRSGALTTSVTGALLERAAREGVRLRSYRLEPGTQVACTAAPEDDFVVVHLTISTAPGDEVTLRTDSELLDTGVRDSQHLQDVPVDRETGAIIVAFAGDSIRSVPRSRWIMHATIRGTSGERTEGPYVLNHTPWHERSAPADA